MAEEKITELNSTNICTLCNNALGRYSCPRCNVRFCSTTCYRSGPHTECSEVFYKGCVLEEMAMKPASSDEERQKMVDILKRLQAEETNVSDDVLDSDDDEAPLDLSERLAGIDLDDASCVWEKLTADERQDFEAFLRSGDVSKVVPPWEPWWMHTDQRKVREINEPTAHAHKYPPICKHIRHFSTITRKPPSHCVKHNLINVIAAYVFVTRYFNGDYFEFPAEVIAYLSTICLTLKNNRNFEEDILAINSVQHEILNTSWIYTDEENIVTMKDDVERILRGNNKDKTFFILCALSDLHKILTTAMKARPKPNKSDDSFATTFPESKFPQNHLVPREQLKLYVKKIDYLLSYTIDCYVN